jgi:putative DNA primase/helicase
MMTHDEANEGKLTRAEIAQLRLEGKIDLASTRAEELGAEFARLHRDRVRYVSDWNKWIAWNGASWKLDHRGLAARLHMHEFFRARILALKGEIKKAGPETSAGRFWAARLGELSKDSKPPGALVAAQPFLSVESAELNRLIDFLPLATMTADLSGESIVMEEPMPERLLIGHLDLTVSKDATCPRFEAFLGQVWPDESVRDFMIRFLGYCLTGSVAENRCLFLHGSGANGKSVFVNVVSAVLGDFVAHVQPSLILRRGEAHPTDKAQLFGKRLAVINEIPSGAKIDDNTLKSITGGDTISARRMHEDFWTFEPTHKLLMLGNHLPRLDGSDPAVWRRLLLVDCPLRLEPDEIDRDLTRKLCEEREGILAIMLQGWLDWKAQGLNPPPEILKATGRYRGEEDPAGAFLAECVIDVSANEPDRKLARTALFRRYAEEMKNQGEAPISSTEFGRKVSRHFERSKREADRRHWFGLAFDHAALGEPPDGEPSRGQD